MSMSPLGSRLGIVATEAFEPRRLEGELAIVTGLRALAHRRTRWCLALPRLERALMARFAGERRRGGLVEPGPARGLRSGGGDSLRTSHIQTVRLVHELRDDAPCIDGARGRDFVLGRSASRVRMTARAID